MPYTAYEHLLVDVDDLAAAVTETGTQAIKNSKRAINAAVNSESLAAAREVEADIWWEQFATEERCELVEQFNEK